MRIWTFRYLENRYYSGYPIAELQCSESTDTSCKFDMDKLEIDPDSQKLNICLVECYLVDYSEKGIVR